MVRWLSLLQPKKASPKATAPTAPKASKSLGDIASTTTAKVNSGGLNLDAVLKDNPEKTARATHNAERHKSLDGKTIREALATRLVDSRDIRYDLKKGFMYMMPYAPSAQLTVPLASLGPFLYPL